MLFKLGKYEIKRELGRGATGIVYEGFDTVIERAAAIKTIQRSLLENPGAEEVFNRFRREAKAAGRLAHPNIVAIYDYGEEDEMAYIVMEFISGRPLSDLIKKSGPFRIGETAQIMLQILDALEYSHNYGVVHRDIKPSNILMSDDNQIKIADFGIARIDSSDLTQDGAVLGTPSHMSPEQISGQVADRRSDIYSAGVILYQLLTGARPFHAENVTAIMHKVLHDSPAPPSSLNRNISAALEEVVLKALSRRPEERFQTASEFRAALKYATEMHALATEAEADSTLAGYDIDRTQPGYDHPETITRTWDLAAGTTRALDKTVSSHPAAPEPSALLSEISRMPGRRQDATERDALVKAMSVHNALDALNRFFTPFIAHINAVTPQIGRLYSLGAGTTYSHLKLQNAAMARYSRTPDSSDPTFLGSVVVSYNLCAPVPVHIKRQRDRIEALKLELQQFKLHILDGPENISKLDHQEWVTLRLSAEIPVQLRFEANHDQYCIDVTTLNLEAFGVSSFRLEANDVTSKSLDQIGNFILGRSNELPSVLRKT